MIWQEGSILLKDNPVENKPDWQNGSVEVGVEEPEQAVTRAQEAIKLSVDHNLSIDEGEAFVAGDEPSAFGKLLGKVKTLADEYVIKSRQIEPELERIETFGKETGRGAVAVGTEAVSKLSLGALDVLTNKTTGDKSLADMVLRTSDLRPLSEEERKKAEGLGYIAAFTVPGMAIRAGLAKVTAANWLKTILGAGLTFGSTEAALQESRKLVTGEPINWKEVHFASGFGVLFGFGEVAVIAAISGLAKGMERYWGSKEIEIFKGDYPGKSLEQQQAAQRVEKIRDIQRAKDSIKAGQGIPKDLMEKYVYGKPQEGSVLAEQKPPIAETKSVSQVVQEQKLTEPAIIGSQAEKEIEQIVAERPDIAGQILYDVKNAGILTKPTPIQQIVEQVKTPAIIENKAVSSPVASETPETGATAGGKGQVSTQGEASGAPQIANVISVEERPIAERYLTNPNLIEEGYGGKRALREDVKSGGKEYGREIVLHIDKPMTQDELSYKFKPILQKGLPQFMVGFRQESMGLSPFITQETQSDGTAKVYFNVIMADEWAKKHGVPDYTQRIINTLKGVGKQKEQLLASQKGTPPALPQGRQEAEIAEQSVASEAETPSRTTPSRARTTEAGDRDVASPQYKLSDETYEEKFARDFPDVESGKLTQEEISSDKSLIVKMNKLYKVHVEESGNEIIRQLKSRSDVENVSSEWGSASSYYITVENKDGESLKIRISDHDAKYDADISLPATGQHSSPKEVVDTAIWNVEHEWGKPTPAKATEATGAEAGQGEKQAKAVAEPSLSPEQRRNKGVLYIPPVTGSGKFAEKYPEADIEIIEKQKDIGVLQKWILTGTNQAYNTGNKDIILAMEGMSDTGISIGNEIAYTLQQDEHFYKSLSKPYLENEGEKFFELMDKHFSPEEIGKADLPAEVKTALTHFKEVEEETRLFIRGQKRDMAAAMLNRKSLPELQEKAKEIGLEITKDGKTKTINKTKDELARDLAAFEIPDDWGRKWSHIQHIFFGQYELKWIEEISTEKGVEQVTHFIGRAETQKEAYEKLADFLDARKANGLPVDIKLVADPEFHIPYDVMRISRNQYYNLQGQLKESAELSSSEIADALKGVIGKKESKQKWWGALQQRKGAEGFSKDFWKVWSMSRIQFVRWKRLTNMNAEIQPLIENVKSQGLTGWANYLEETKDYVWGRGRGSASVEFDRLLAKSPIIGDYVKPFALERWSGMIRTVQYWRQLQTVKFGVINSLQPLQTLYPVIGEKGMYRAFKLFFSKEGEEILERHHIKLIGGKLAERNMKVSQNWMRFTPAGWSEKNNQALAFLGVYDKGRQLGMSDTEAARYARLRGQLFTQFLPAAADTPKAFRGPIRALIGQYRRFNIKQWELLSRLIRERSYSGVARFAAVRVLLGGLTDIWKLAKIAGGGYLTYKAYNYLKEKYGKDTADVIHHGLPALVGVDITGSIDMFVPPQGSGMQEKIGNLILGPTGQTINQLYEAEDKKMAIEKGATERTLDILLDTSPAIKQFEYLFKAYEKDTSNYNSYEALNYQLEVEDLWKKALGFTPETESLQRMVVDAMRDLYKQYDETMDEIVTLTISGKYDRAIEEIAKWDAMYPEAPISGKSIEERIANKVKARNLFVTERNYLKLPDNLKKIFEGSGQIIKESATQTRTNQMTTMKESNYEFYRRR